MTKYPIREPFNNLKYANKQDLYKKLLISLYNREDTLEDTPILLRDIYTPLFLGFEENTSNKISVEEAICKYQFIAISGVAGSGKSTITKFLSLETSQDGTNKTIEMIGKRVVMPIILRELEFNKIKSLDELFSQWIDNLNQNLKKPIFDREFFDFYINKGWAILIFDGFDEIGFIQNRNLIKWLNEYIQTTKLQENKIKTNIIITGRPTGFLSDTQYDNFQKLYLQPYTQEQIETYISKYMDIQYSPNKKMIEERKSKFLSRLDSISDLKQLKTRPIYLMMLAFISEHKGEIPRSRVLAYQLMVEAYIHILDKQRNLYEKEHKDDISLPNWDYQDKYIMLEELAYRFHLKASRDLKEDSNTSQLQIEVSINDLKNYLREIVKDEDEKLKSVNKDENVDKIVDYYLSRSGLLVEPRDGYIQFSHLSFQEFLTASKIYRDKDDLDLINYLNEEIFNKLDKVGFNEIAQLYFGIDSLKGGKNQFKITTLIFRDKLVYHQFIYDLIFLTENRLKEEEELNWLKTLIFLWINKSNVYKFKNLIIKLEKDIREYRIEFYEDIKEFLFNIAEQILKNSIDFKPIKLKNVKELENNYFNKLENILYIGFYFESFILSFLTKDSLELFPKNERNKCFIFLLDKYIPYNKNLKENISNIIINNISFLSLINLNGSDYLTFSHLSIMNNFYRELLKIQFIINKNLLFLIKNNMKKFYYYIIYVFKDISINDSNYITSNVSIIVRSMYHWNRKYKYKYKSREIIDMIKDIYSNMTTIIDNVNNSNMLIARDMAEQLYADIYYSRSICKKKEEDIENLVLKAWLYLFYTSSKRYVQKVELDINMSKKEFINLYNQLNTNLIEYFENKGFELTQMQKDEIKELFEKSYLLKTMEYIINETEYEEFDEEKALNDFHNAIKEFNKKYGESSTK